MADEKADSIIEVKDDPVKLEYGDFVVDKDGNLQPKRLTYDLYQQQQKAQARQAATAGGLALAGELGQFFVGLGTMNDPTIKAARRDLARLEAKTRESGPLITEAEKMDMRQAAMAPVMRAQESLERKAQNIAAASGDASARTFLQAAKVGLENVRQQALNVEAKISQEKVRRATARDERIERARGQADSIRATMLDLRNTYVREPTHKFIGDAAKFTGTILANQPAPDIRSALKEAKEKGATNEQLNKILSARNARELDRVMGEILGTGQTADSKKVRGEGSRGRELSDAQKAIQEADDAAKMTRTEPPEPDQEEDVDSTGLDIDATEEEIKAQVDAEESETDRAIRKRKEAEEERLRRGRQISRTGAYSKSNFNPLNKTVGGDFAWNKGSYTYVFDPKNETWYVYRGREKIDYEVTLDEAEVSGDPNVRELYDLALVNNLSTKNVDRELAESMG